jgi:hypothetical protein
MKIRLSDKLAPNYALPNFLFIIFEIKKKKNKELHIELSPYFLSQGSFKLGEPPLVPKS